MRMRLMLAALLIGCQLAPPLLSRVQSQRGQGVRIKGENGREIDLYDESHALVIGVRKYTNGWRELPGAEKDAEAIGALLRRQGFEVTVVLSPTSAQLNDALSAFISERGLKERNRLVIYFAGHGYTEALADGRELGYIVPADAPLPERNPQLFSRRAVSMDEIEAKALRIRSKHALFVFDSCFSGSIFETRGERYVPPEIESKTAAPVRMFITAGTKNQTVPDDSIFRIYFVRAFEQREGDLNRDGFITGEELGMYLAGRVASNTRDTQTPRYGKIKDARLNLGDIVFALPRREVPPPAPTFSPPADRCAIAWETIKNTESEGTIQEFLRGCKDSAQAFAANLRLSDLRARPNSKIGNTGSPSSPELSKPKERLPTDGASAQRKTRLLFVTECKGFRHAVLPQAEEIMEQLGAKNGFDVMITQKAENELTPATLKNLDVIVFYTTGELPLSDAQKAALLDWIRSGKFFLGIHSATDTFYRWPEYGQMIGGYFNKHPWTQDTDVTIKTEDRAHPVTRHLPEGWSMKEEIFQIKDFIGRDKAHVLVSLDQTKTDMNRPGVEAKDFPLVWWRDYGIGKVMYNAMGHRPDVWTSEWYQTMIVNAIKWGTGQSISSTNKPVSN